MNSISHTLTPPSSAEASINNIMDMKMNEFTSQPPEKSNVQTPQNIKASNAAPFSNLTANYDTSSVITESSQNEAAKFKKQSNNVAKACSNCKSAHLACDESRPCRRCAAVCTYNCLVSNLIDFLISQGRPTNASMSNIKREVVQG